MGILNVTPDSFAGSVPDPDAAIDAAAAMEAAGADLIDVGGESTRPGADAVPPDEQLRRVLPVVRAAAARLRIPISVDTRDAAVAGAVLDAGAALVNDVSGLRHDPSLARVVAERQGAFVLMHSRGDPKTMGERAEYQDLVGETIAELRASMAAAERGGVPPDRVILDPGIGFA